MTILNQPTRKNLIIAVIFLYSCAFLINYLVKNITALHWGKDGGSVTIAIFHCISCYIFFLILHRSIITFLGLGLFVGFISCTIDIILSNIFQWNISDWYMYMLTHQILSCTIVFFSGILYYSLVVFLNNKI